MSVQVRMRAGIMIAASAVVVSGLGYGAAVGAGPVDGLRMEAAAVTAPPTVATVTAAAVTTKATTGVAKAVATTTSTKTTVSRPAVVTPVATSLTMIPVSTTVTKVQYFRAVFHATLTNAKTKTPLGDQKVTLYRRLPSQAAWTQLTWDKSDTKSGKVFLAVVQTAASAQYKMVFAGKSPYVAATSPVITIKRG